MACRQRRAITLRQREISPENRTSGCVMLKRYWLDKRGLHCFELDIFSNLLIFLQGIPGPVGKNGPKGRQVNGSPCYVRIWTIIQPSPFMGIVFCTRDRMSNSVKVQWFVGEEAKKYSIWLLFVISFIISVNYGWKEACYLWGKVYCTTRGYTEGCKGVKWPADWSLLAKTPHQPNPRRRTNNGPNTLTQRAETHRWQDSGRSQD